MTPQDAEQVAAGGPWLIVGLGNPGPRYAANRHNLGSMVLDRLAAVTGGTFGRHRARAEVLEGRLGGAGGRRGERVVLAKPMSYVNESGGPVSGLVRFYRVPLQRLLVVHDELDIPFGEVRLKFGGGEGGHNGVRSITRSLGSPDFCRLRLGIGRPPGQQDPADFVLRDFPKAVRDEVHLMIENGVDAVQRLVADGMERARTVVNART